MTAPLPGSALRLIALLVLLVRPAVGWAQGEPFTDSLASLTAGEHITCLTTTPGAAYCWGDTRRDSSLVYPLLTDQGRRTPLRSVAPALWSLCGLTFKGEIWCDPSAPDLADSITARPPGCALGSCIRPLRARGHSPGGAVRDLVRGFEHGCFIGPDALAYCWGRNAMGQLGKGSWEANPPGHSGIVRPAAPVVGGLRFARLSAREYQTCGITLSVGQVFCWGYGQSGQTGDSALVADCDRPREPAMPCSSLVPVRVLPESLPGERVQPSKLQFVQVAAGGRLACAVSIHGAAYCWGDNYRCALGRCRSGQSSRARLIPIPGRVVEVGAGYQFACARTADGRIYCWGDNSYGQLGSLVSINAGPDGLPPDYRDTSVAEIRSAAYDDPCFLGGRCSPAAAEVNSPHRWSALAVGQEHVCALATDDGGIYCWGGTDPKVLARDGFPMTCVNRSFSRPNKRCQPTPVRVPGLPLLRPAAVLSSSPKVATARDSLSNALVEISTRRVRIAFPVDTAGTWGWPAGRSDIYQGYVWSAHVGSVDGPASIMLSAYHRDSSALTFSSLEQLVATARPALLCLSEKSNSCSNSKVAARVRNHRVTLTVDDSSTIARLFGTRPERVRLARQSAYEPAYETALVPVQYVAPQIPQPDSALLARAERGRRRHEASITSIGRTIKGGEGWWGVDDLWVALGDSLQLNVEEMHCHYDNCGMWRHVSDSGWSVKDRSVVALRPGCGVGCVTAYGRRVGKTTISVRGLHGPSDTMPSSRPPPRKIERRIRVGRPVTRVAILPRRDTVLVGQPYTFGAQAFDSAGRVVPDVPIEIVVDIGHNLAMLATKPYPAEFRTTGRRPVIATFRGLADTLMVTVLGQREP